MELQRLTKSGTLAKMSFRHCFEMDISKQQSAPKAQ